MTGEPATPSFSGKTYVVTGASRGIGRAVARALLARGAEVVGFARSFARPDAAAEAAGGRTERFVAVGGDVGEPADVERLAGVVSERGGAVAGLIHSAGVLVPGGLASVAPDEVRRTLAVNVAGPWFVTRALLPFLRAGRPSTVVNVVSIAPTVPQPSLAIYGASKAALLHLSESWREALRDDGIRVCALLPGSTATPMVEPLVSDTSWMLRPEDVADAVLFLLERPERALVSRLDVRPMNRPR